MRDEFLWVEKYRPKTIDECIVDSETAPNWVCGVIEGLEENYITDVGSAPSLGASNNFVRKSALANARGNLAQQLKTHIVDKASNKEKLSAKSNEKIITYDSSQSTQQVSELSMKNSKQLAWWQHPGTKEIYILVGISKKDISSSNFLLQEP